MSITAPDPTGGGGLPPPGGAGGGQGVQILQQIQDLLAQLMQSESDPAVQRAVQAMAQLVDPLMQAVGQSDAGNMTSGISNPGGPADLTGGAPDLTGGGGGLGAESPAEEAAEGPPPTTFGGAKKAAMANFGAKGHFSKTAPKGETPQTQRTKNRQKASKG